MADTGNVWNVIFSHANGTDVTTFSSERKALLCAANIAAEWLDLTDSAMVSEFIGLVNEGKYRDAVRTYLKSVPGESLEVEEAILTDTPDATLLSQLIGSIMFAEANVTDGPEVGQEPDIEPFNKPKK